MRGTYCLIMELQEKSRIEVGSLGDIEFRAGIYVYVGSALAGIEKRVARHRSQKKRRKWHIDFLLDKAQVLSVIAIPTDTKKTECEVARALLECEGARAPVTGFGSSDCSCRSHLISFESADTEWIGENISRRLSMLECVYQRTRAQ